MTANSNASYAIVPAEDAAPDPLAEHPRIRRRLIWLSRWLDTAFRVPGTNFHVGLDGLVGLVPVVGNVVTTGVSLYILIEAKRARVPLPTLIKMGVNIAADTAIGTVPVIGDAADFVFKSNQRNLELLGIRIEAAQDDAAQEADHNIAHDNEPSAHES